MPLPIIPILAGAAAGSLLGYAGSKKNVPVLPGALISGAAAWLIWPWTAPGVVAGYGVSALAMRPKSDRSMTGQIPHRESVWDHPMFSQTSSTDVDPWDAETVLDEDAEPTFVPLRARWAGETNEQALERLAAARRKAEAQDRLDAEYARKQANVYRQMP